MIHNIPAFSSHLIRPKRECSRTRHIVKFEHANAALHQIVTRSNEGIRSRQFNGRQCKTQTNGVGSRNPMKEEKFNHCYP